MRRKKKSKTMKESHHTARIARWRCSTLFTSLTKISQPFGYSLATHMNIKLHFHDKK